MDPADAIVTRMTVEEYLVYDATHEGKHEFYNGEVVAMAGSTLVHALLAVNVSSALHVRLRGGPFRVFSSDLRIAIEQTGAYVYPDVSVVCGAARVIGEAPGATTNPTLLVEVLSPTTEAHDRGAKAAHYRHIEGLKAYALVSSMRRHVEVHYRGDDGIWRIHEAEAAGTVHIPTMDLALSLGDVYAGWDGAG